MKECDRFEKTIRAYVSGDQLFEELQPMLEHCRSCVECRQILELHQDLTDLGAAIEVPDASEFEAVRERVLNEAARRGQGRRTRRWGWQLSAPFGLRPVAVGALALLVFAVGLVAGRHFSDSTAGEIDSLMADISNDAVSNRKLIDVENSPYTYSDVSFRRLDDDRVALAFDVSTHVELTEPMGSEVVKEVLVHSLLNPSNTGSRLKAISYAAELMDPKVKQALIFAMRRDGNLAVRLKAMSILSDQPADLEVESAVLAALRGDESVQMRLEALDYLASRSFDHDLLRRTVEEAETSDDAALLVRLAEYER